MEFFSRHYEKIILAALLVLLSLLLLLLSKDVYMEGSPLDTPEANDPSRVYQTEDFGQKKFDLPGVMAEANAAWVPEYNAEGYIADLTFPMVLAKCPYCRYLIPLTYFSEQPCPNPICGRMISPRRPPWERPKPNAVVIPIEELYDDDGDGFSLRYEQYAGTNPYAPQSHPPLWERLYVTEVAKVPLGGTLSVVNAPKGDNRRRWYIQIDVPVKDNQGNDTGEINRPLLFLGDRINIDGTRFELIDITPRYPADSEANDATNDSTALLKEADGDLELELKVGATAYYPEQKVFMKDLGSREEYRVDVGDVIVMGNLYIGMEQYQVTDRDTENLTVTLQDVNGNTAVIRTEAIVPREMRVRERTAPAAGTQPGVLPYGPNMPMPYMPGR